MILLSAGDDSQVIDKFSYKVDLSARAKSGVAAAVKRGVIKRLSEEIFAPNAAAMVLKAIQGC